MKGWQTDRERESQALKMSGFPSHLFSVPFRRGIQTSFIDKEVRIHVMSVTRHPVGLRPVVSSDLNRKLSISFCSISSASSSLFGVVVT
jgi:hypothetical protein